MKNKIFILFLVCLSINLTSGIVWSQTDATTSESVVISGNIIQFLNYNVSASGIGATTANITWMTNGISNSIVDYGLDTGYGSTETNATSTLSHLVKLNSLTQHTTYHYKITSKMSDGASTTSADNTFTTTYQTGTTVASETAGTTITGVSINTTASGAQQVNISTTAQATATKTDDKTVTISNPGSGWSSLKYVGSEVVTDGSTLSVNNIQSIVMTSTPVTTDLGGNIGTASAKIDVPLTKPVSGVAIEQKIIQGATTDAANAFQLAATSSSLDIKSVAYTVKFENTAILNDNLDKTKGITLDFSVAHAWVEENGGTANIKIFRFGDDGTKEVLSTTHTGSSGSTDNFRAISYNGLSTFGMTAVASTVSGGGGSGGSGSGGSTGGGGSIGGTSDFPVVIGRAGPVQQALAPVIQEINKLLAPFQEPAVVTRPISVAGLSVTTKPGGIQTIQLAKGLAEKSGAGISVTGTGITVRQPDFILVITTRDIPVNENGMITGTVSRVDLATAPVSAPLSIGTASFSLDTQLASVPENGMITTTMTETVDPAMVSAYQSAAFDSGRQVEDIAYSVMVEKTALPTTGPAAITLSVSPDWVMTHGGTSAVAIAHLADDGTAEMLGTAYSGLDKSGNIIFIATSPRGLSSFSLVSLKDLPRGTTQVPAGEPAVVHEVQQQQGGVVQNIAGVSARFVHDNLIVIALIIILMLAAGAVIIIDDRRSGNKKKHQKK